jgi:hypothetical protein
LRSSVEVIRLPVAGIEVELGLPAGKEDLLLLESGQPSPDLAIALLRSLAMGVDGNAIDWSALVVTDLDVLLLRLRQRVLGDVVRSDVRCRNPACGARVDITFSVGDYIMHHRPRPTRGLLPADEAGWHRLADTDVMFRLPCAADQLAVACESDPGSALLQRCVRPADIPSRILRRVESAMQAMAPSLRSDLRGSCPECGMTVNVDFDPLQYTLRELRQQAAFIYEEVDCLARRYHWSEAEILALPAMRRARYVEVAESMGA